MSFLASLSFPDLQRLRAVVRRTRMHYYPVELQTDHEADRIIESLGGEIMEKMLKAAVDRKLS